jgi:DNA-binding MarR family transcriptional regulator
MKDVTKEELVEQTLQLADRVARELLPIAPKEMLLPDVTMAQLKIMLILFLGGPERMGFIASELGISLATATGIVDRMVEREIVTREDDPEDRRVVLCRLSEKGQEMLSGLWQSARNRTRELLTAVPDTKLSLVNEALEILSQAGEITKGGGSQG